MSLKNIKIIFFDVDDVLLVKDDSFEKAAAAHLGVKLSTLKKTIAVLQKIKILPDAGFA